jgi:hypothetical protein
LLVEELLPWLALADPLPWLALDSTNVGTTADPARRVLAAPAAAFA